MSVESGRQAARAIDRRRVELGESGRFAPPGVGWVRAVREGLGMSAAALAGRLGITQSSVLALEASERDGKARLSTLRRTAEALDCDLVYALVPRSDLETIVHARALALADEHLKSVAHSMELEGQSTPVTDELREEIAQKIVSSGRLWT